MADLAPVHFDLANVDITLTPPATLKAVADALTNNTPFDASAFKGGVIPLGSIGAEASKDFTLDNVKFLQKVSVGGKLSAGFGVYRSGAKLAADLQAEGLANELNEPAVGPVFPESTTKDLYALRWGYELSGKAQGSLPLGGLLPPVTFGVSGRKAGLFAVVRAQDRTANALDAVTDTLNSWTMPGRVSSPDALKPGTWVVAENDASLGFNLGLEYGYNFSWVRESLKVGGLSGDLGFKIEMGVKAALGFTASGRFATVLSRESDRNELRLRVFRMRERGWTFAFDASVGAQMNKTGLIPDNFEDFVKGIFNVNGNQVLKDFVDTFEKWSDPDSKIADLLGEELVERAKAFFEKVTGKNPETEFEAGRALLAKAVDRWRGLPHELSTLLYGLLKKEGVPLDDLRDFLDKVKKMTDPQELAGEITSRIEAVNFHGTPVGKWLSAVAKGRITDLLTDLATKARRDRFVELADKTAALLDGSEVEKVLKELQDWFEDKLGLDKILAITNTSFKDADAWLKKRLADFLDKELGDLVFADVKKVQQAIQTLKDNASKFYDKGLEALKQKYTAEFHFSYSKTTTKTALIDVTFNFDPAADPGIKPATISGHLKDALSGNFTTLLSQQIPGVKLNSALLTHGINRNTHLEIGLPYFKSAIDHITTSEAKVNIVDTDGGRLWAFNLKAEDTVSKRHSLSKLSLSLEFTRGLGVRAFSSEELGDESYRYNYQLRMVRAGARRAFLENKVGPAAKEFLASQFQAADKGSFSDFLTALDKRLDGSGLPDNDFGNLLYGLDLSLSSAALAAWKNVTVGKNDDIYMDMSLLLQRLMRRMTLDAYTQDPSNFGRAMVVKLYPLLAYSALPGINRLKLVGGKLKFTRDAVLDWDPRDADQRAAVFEQFCAARLRDEILPRLEEELRGNDDALELIAPTTANIEKILNFNIGSDRPKAVDNFESLAFSEAIRVKDIRDAAVKFRKSLDSQKAEEAAKSLAEFGDKFVRTFGQGLNERYVGTEFRPFGTALFAETARFFGGEAEATRPTALLELLVLPKDTPYNLKDYLAGKRPADDAPRLIEQRVVSADS